MMKKNLLTLLVFCLTVLTAQAQIQTPQPSPSSMLKQTVGLTEVTIEYSRPSMRGRTVFGDLVPYGEMWRTGANASTKLTFSEDVKIAGNELKKGTYALYTIPGKEEWTVVIHKNTSYWGVGGYKAEEDAFRFTAKPITLNDAVETFTIGISDITNDGAMVNIKWENTKVSFEVSVNTDATVTASIEKTLAGPDMNAYYAAASYYLSAGKDMKKAKEWMDLAMEKGANEKFWMVRRKALIEAELGNYEEAIKAAKLSKELAEKAKNNDYVRMNEKSIEEWSSKK